MASANFFNGYSVDKPTSKVMAPPGGRSNNIFGVNDEPAAGVNSKPAALNGAPTQQKKVVEGVQNQQHESKVFNEPVNNQQSKPTRRGKFKNMLKSIKKSLNIVLNYDFYFSWLQSDYRSNL